MIDLKNLSIEQLNELSSAIEKEILSRSDYEATYQLPYQKTRYGMTKKQVDLIFHLAEKTNSNIPISTSQLMKRGDKDFASELIESMQSGMRIEVEG